MPMTRYIAVHTNGRGGWTWRVRQGDDPHVDHLVKDRATKDFDSAADAADDALSKHAGLEVRVER